MSGTWCIAEQAGTGFALEQASGPVTLLGTENRMRQAVGNLLDNALKFTPAGGSVGVSLRAEDR